MKILGVSGSPIKNSNTDRALKYVLNATGAAKTEFIKLSEYTVAPCLGCLECIETNRCIIKDDGIKLAEKAYKADVLIIAGFTPYSTLDSRTKAFIERLYPLHHRHGLMQGKVGAGIITCAAIPADNKEMPPACDNGMQAIQYYMAAEGMNFAGGVTLKGNVPCIKCADRQCSVSAFKVIYGAEATVADVGKFDFEEDPVIMQELDALSKKIQSYF